jgi:hypothetical protein
VWGIWSSKSHVWMIMITTIIITWVSPICITLYNLMRTVIVPVKVRKHTSDTNECIKGIKPHKCITPQANNTAGVSTTVSSPPITSHILMFLHLILTLTSRAPWRKTLLWKWETSTRCQYLKSEALRKIQYKYFSSTGMTYMENLTSIMSNARIWWQQCLSTVSAYY